MFCGANPVVNRDEFGLDSDNPVLQWLFHKGNVYNATSEPVKVIGSDPSGEGRREWWVAPGTWGSENQYGITDVDAVYVGDQVIKIHGRLGSWLHIPEAIRPEDYSGRWGWFYRGFGWNPIVDPERRFGPLLPDADVKAPDRYKEGPCP